MSNAPFPHQGRVASPRNSVNPPYYPSQARNGAMYGSSHGAQGVVERPGQPAGYPVYGNSYPNSSRQRSLSMSVPYAPVPSPSQAPPMPNGYFTAQPHLYPNGIQRPQTPMMNAMQPSSPPASYYGHSGSPLNQVPASPQRPFACDMCALSFNRQHDLKRHKETHSGERPFLCNGPCGKTFTRKDALKRHQLVKGCGISDD